jgi:hypothetical protein
MSLCEMWCAGDFGWLGVVAPMVGAFGLGVVTGGAFRAKLHRLELLAAREIGRREGRRGGSP